MLHLNHYPSSIDPITNGTTKKLLITSVVLRKSERQYLKCKTISNLASLIIIRHNHNLLINTTKASFYKYLVASTGHDFRKRFSICNSLLGRSKILTLPNGQICGVIISFVSFFKTKVDKLISAIPSPSIPQQHSVYNITFLHFTLIHVFIYLNLLNLLNLHP